MESGAVAWSLPAQWRKFKIQNSKFRIENGELRMENKQNPPRKLCEALADIYRHYKVLVYKVPVCHGSSHVCEKCRRTKALPSPTN